MPCSAASYPSWARLAAALALPLLVSGCNTADAAPAAAGAPYVLTASGRLDSRSEARTLVAQKDGIIAQVLVQRDEVVVVGQPIVRLSCHDAIAALAVARADAAAAAAQARLVAEGPRHEDVAAASARVDEARANYRDAVDQLGRVEALIDRGFVSKRRVVELQSTVTARKAQLAAVEAEALSKKSGSRPDEHRSAEAVSAAAAASVAMQSAMLEKCTLRSPIDGKVVQVLKREGEFSGASSGAPIAVVADLGAMIVRAEIADRDAVNASVGQSVDVWIDGDHRHWRGAIIGIASLMGRKTARSLDPSDRFDRDVREAIIGFNGAQPPAIIGLRVNIGVVS